MNEETMPPGKYVEEWRKFKVGQPFRNRFNRNPVMRFIYVCDDGRVLGYYHLDGQGVQLLNSNECEPR